MKVIQSGKEAVEKEYSTLGSSISTEGGSLDISKLADPNTESGTTEQAEPAPTTSPRKVKSTRSTVSSSKDSCYTLKKYKPLYSVQASRPAMIEKRESGYLSSSPHSSAMPSPPQSVATPPDSAIYTVSKRKPDICLCFLSVSNTPFGTLQGRSFIFHWKLLN